MEARNIRVGSKRHGNKQIATVSLTRHGWAMSDGGIVPTLMQAIVSLQRRGYATQYQEVIS